MSRWLLAAFTIFSTTQFYALGTCHGQNLTWEEMRQKHGLSNSIHFGYEYDTNVFKTFGQKKESSLIRALYTSQGVADMTENFRLGWNFSGGGKKYFSEPDQDVFLFQFETPLIWKMHPKITLSYTPKVKYQDEADSLDDRASVPLDINEDYFSIRNRLVLRARLPLQFTIEPFASHTYFLFHPEDLFSFHRERFGLSLRNQVHRSISMGTQYAYSLQQFETTTREDKLHEVSVFAQYMGIPYLSGQYTFQSTDSSDARFDYSNHRVQLILSMPFGARKSALTSSDPSDTGSLFAIHVIGTLQLKRFPSVFDFTDEGQRYLLTGAEDENFNSILVKLSFHPYRKFAFEGKYTRYSNALSSQEDSFARSLFYGGIRFLF